MIPGILCHFFDSKYYKVKGSIGKGLISKSPWIAIMKKSITTSTQKGVYLLFLFDKDFNRVYIGLSQSVAAGYYLGTRKNKIELAKLREDIRHNLHLDLPYLDYNIEEIEIANRMFKESLIYACLWDYKTIENKDKILENYTKAYLLYDIHY